MNNSNHVLRRQKKHFFYITSAALLLMGATSYVLMQEDSPASLTKASKVELPVDKVNVQDIWMNRQDTVIQRLEADKKVSDQKMKMLEEIVLSGKKKEEESDKEKFELKKMMSSLQQELKSISSQVEKQASSREIASLLPPEKPSAHICSTNIISSSKDPFISPSRFFAPPPPPPSSSLNLPKKEERILKPPLRAYTIKEEEVKKVFNVNKMVPAAVSVKALLVSSVDAVCGIYANSDPVPVKLRLLDDGHLPKGVTVKLKGSLVLASAYGNLSNERVYMRLERLTQVNAKGEAIETEVVGYVTGEDGKFGVRGTVIDRSVKIVKNAAASGFLGGIGQVLQASVTKHPVDCWNTYSVGADAATKSAANGVSSAFDMLAEYYIKRAEQVQPVLQVGAGRIVDITFTHGFAKGDLHTKEKLREIRQNARGPVR